MNIYFCSYQLNSFPVRKVKYKIRIVFSTKEMIPPICHVIKGCKSNKVNFKRFCYGNKTEPRLQIKKKL